MKAEPSPLARLQLAPWRPQRSTPTEPPSSQPLTDRRIDNFKQLPVQLADLLRKTWRRYQRARIDKAIRTYAFEKHCLGRYYHPVVSSTLMRSCAGRVEKDRFPFHVKREKAEDANEKVSGLFRKDAPWKKRLPYMPPPQITLTNGRAQKEPQKTLPNGSSFLRL